MNINHKTNGGISKSQVTKIVAEEVAKILTGELDLLDLVTNKIINTNTNRPVKFWVGTKLEYDEITVRDKDTVYLLIAEEDDN